MFPYNYKSAEAPSTLHARNEHSSIVKVFAVDLSISVLFWRVTECSSEQPINSGLFQFSQRGNLRPQRLGQMVAER